MADLIVLGIIAIAAGSAVYSLIKDKKKSTASGGCSGCNGCSGCSGCGKGHCK